jgi:hypothetical protein
VFRYEITHSSYSPRPVPADEKAVSLAFLITLDSEIRVGRIATELKCPKNASCVRAGGKGSTDYKSDAAIIVRKEDAVRSRSTLFSHVDVKLRLAKEPLIKSAEV